MTEPTTLTSKTNEGMSYETKTIIVILCLLFITPVGLILMWVWMKWPLGVRILLTVLPFLFAFFIAGFVIWLLAMIFSNKDVQKQLHEHMQQQQNVRMSQTSNNDSTNIKDQINGFPIYPKSSYISQKKEKPCPSTDKPMSGFAVCSATSYTWVSPDDYDAISQWYANDPTKSGWYCGGGGGSYTSPRNADTRKTCTRGDMNYTLDIYTTEKQTEITLRIPY